MFKVLYGENDYEISQRKKASVADYLKKTASDIGLEQFNHDVDKNKLWQSIVAQPFLVDSKLIIINNPSQNTELAEFIVSKLQDIPETTSLIIVEGKLDKRTGYYKSLKKLKEAEEIKPFDDSKLSSWLIEKAKDKSLKVTQAQARKIIQRTGSDQWTIASEIEKLAAYDELTDQLIDDLVEASPQESIFNLLDSLAAGRAAEAQELYQGLRQQQLDPHYVLSMLTWQMDNILIVAFAGNRSDRDIASEAKINPYVVQKTRSLTSRMNHSSVKKAVGLICDMDEQLKTTKTSPDDGVKLLLLQLAEVFA